MKDGFWQQMRNLSGGVHVFDLIEHDNKIFAGMGVLAGNSPIAASEDGGINFYAIKLYKNGSLLDTSGFGARIRAYDFFKLKVNYMRCLFMTALRKFIAIATAAFIMYG